MSKEPEGPPKPDQPQTDGQAERPETSSSQETPKQESAPEARDDFGQALGQAEHPDLGGEEQDHDIHPHDDPYHHDYEHEDHEAYHAHHDEHYHHGHEEYQGDSHDEHATTTPVPFGGSSDGGDDNGPTDIDENGEEYGGPVKSFLEHMEDLRWTLIRCVASVFVAMVVCLAGAPYLVEILAWPLTKARQSLTENQKTSLLKEQKSEIIVRLTEKETFRVPIQTDLLDDAREQLALTNSSVMLSFQLAPVVRDGKLQLLLQPDTNAVAGDDISPRAGPELKAMGPLSGFLVALKLAFYGGIMLSSPFILFFIGQFTIPALRKKEKKYLIRAVIVGGFLFFSGVAFCYFLVMQIALSTSALFANWLTFGADVWRAEEYINFVCKFMLGMGIAFELPVVILLLVKVGVLDYKKLSAFRMYWVVINLVLASILTPPDLVTQILMALPMQFFYECSVIIAWIWYRRDRKKEAAEAAAPPPDEP
ncbi:MAG: twin-arginine translocase subunit TatC [Verrucomicrobiota bacterium]|jgi:sec-independent protein translocase protein TatC|nr:twin-arginine translocase subunit TatC [Verrucomicrobiota bacterium]MDP7048853.1 twin-arginine translocase subunit TatC [Verrucomicrobiota bacterium]